MNTFEVKKIISVERDLSLQESEKLLVSDNCCLGILNENREITGFVKREDLLSALKYEIKHLPVNIIAVTAEIAPEIDLNDGDIIKLQQKTSKQGLFLGKSRQEIQEVVVFNPNIKTFTDITLKNEYLNNMPEEIQKALKLCSDCADSLSIPIYLVGGAVRDLVLRNNTFDIDITVEDNAIEFVKILRKENPTICRIIETHEDFKTAKIELKTDKQTINIDITSTRKEIYPAPAGLPVLITTGGSIEEDLSRRDFSINAMAISLNSNTFCNLTDPFSGYQDLKERKVRILHNLSFIEDPTRIIRGLKFRVRFGFQLDDTTKNLQKACLESGLFNGLCGERIKSELKQTFNINNPLCLEKFIEEKMLLLIDQNIYLPEKPKEAAKSAYDTISANFEKINKPEFVWLIYLGVLVSEFTPDKITDIAGKLYLSGLETEILLGSKCILNLKESLIKAQTNYEIYEKLEGYFPESSLTALATSENEQFKEKVRMYLKELQDIQIYTNGKTLIEAGLVPGPVFGEILREILKGKVNGEIKTQEDEEKLIKKYTTTQFNN